MISSARLGDRHVCPLPGHGITPITSASLILDFMALGIFRQDGSVDDERMAALLASPDIKEKAISANAMVDPEMAGSLQERPKQKTAPDTCNDPDMMEELAAYIATEMNTNINHPSILRMKELLSYDVAQETHKQLALPWYAQMGATRPQIINVANGAAALALFTERVGQDCVWEHKPILARKYEDVVYHKQGKYDYFYDIWSNIHYGYVGRAGGLSESILLDGAGAEQIVSDTLRKIGEVLKKPSEERRLPGPNRSADIEGLRAWDDAPDRTSISIGIKLYSQHPTGGITAKMIMNEILALPPEAWGAGIREHKCKRN